MTKRRFPLAVTTWDEAEYAAMQRVIASGQFTMGPQVAEFERAFAAYNQSRFAVMCNSGSSANLLIIAALSLIDDPALKLRPGDEVLVPAISWSTTYSPLAQYGLKLRFVDIDLGTLNFDLEKLATAVTAETRAILCVNLLGNPNDFDVVRKIAAAHGLVVIEDNCEALGAEFNGKKTGTFGIAGSYSCFFSHHISTMEGGLITTDREDIYHLLLALRAHGWTRQLPSFSTLGGRKSDNAFEESFRFVVPGYNLRPLELSGAIGIEQLRKLPSLIEARRQNGKSFQQAMHSHPDLLIQEEVGQSSWFGFSLIIRPGSSLRRPQLMRKLDHLGFDYRPIVGGNFATKEVMSYFDHSLASKLETAEYVDANGLFVGNHHFPIDDAIHALSSID